MRVLVTITPAHKELLSDLESLPARQRAERLRALAHASLLGGTAGGERTRIDSESHAASDARLRPLPINNKSHKGLIDGD